MRWAIRAQSGGREEGRRCDLLARHGSGVGTMFAPQLHQHTKITPQITTFSCQDALVTSTLMLLLSQVGHKSKRWA